MFENIGWVEGIIGVLGAISVTNIVTLVNINSSKKKAKAEAVTVEISNLRETMQVMRDSYTNTLKQVDKRVDKLQDELSDINQKYQERVIAIRQAYICKVPSEECPVLMKQLSFDELHECEECTGCNKSKAIKEEEQQ